jgi:gas vesicle protein
MSGKKEFTSSSSASKQHIFVYLMYVGTGLIIGSSIISLSIITPVNSVYGQEDLSMEENTIATALSDPANNSQVKFGSNIEQVIGHLDAATLNKERGNDTLALAHAFHPVAEVYSLIEPTIANTNSTLYQTLSSTLDNLTAIVRNSTAEEFSIDVKQAKELLNQTIETAIPLQLRDNATFNLMIVIDLLTTAEHEYEEAVSNNTIREIVEYQDAQAFISHAQTIFGQISDKIPQNMSETVQEINEMFSNLNGKIMNISSFESVQTTIQQIMHEVSEIAGISDISDDTTGQSSSSQLISNIRNLLNQTITEYDNQNYSEAESLATEAYLENYEYIEDPLAEKNQTLMETTELMLIE